MKRILTGAIGLFLLSGVWVSPSAWAASPINSCGDIAQSGAYTLNADLQGASGSTCVHIHDVSNVQLDCQGHTISSINIVGSLRLDNVSNFSVSNCNLIVHQGYGFLITNSNGGVISSNTIQGLAIDDNGGQIIGTSSNIQIVSNLFTDSYTQSYASHMTVQNNRVILSTSSNASGGMEFSYGSQNHVLQNTITGGSQIANNELGGDDGIGLNNETSDLIQGNTVSGFWDCGLETTGLFSSSTISGNTFSNIGRCGIGGWYTNSWLGNTVSNNTVQDTLQFLAIYRIFGLQSGETNVYFLNNSFNGNAFTSSSNTTQFGLPSIASYIDFQSQGAALIPPAQLILGNNVFTNNQFGTFQPGSGSISFTPESMIVDGGGNSCSLSFDSQFPLSCGLPLPNPPTGLSFNRATSSSLTLSWTASTGSVTVSDYHVDVSTDASFGSFVGPYNNFDAGNAPAGLVIIGLQPSTTYFARARGYNAASIGSFNSLVAYGTTLLGSVPSITINSPASGADVFGREEIDVFANSLTSTIQRVDYLSDGQFLGSASAYPYTFYFDTTVQANGTHQLTARAYDVTGASGTATIPVTVANYPLFQDNFNSGNSSAWAIVDDGNLSAPSHWQELNGTFNQTSPIHGSDAQARLGTQAVTGDSTWTDYSVSLRMRPVDGDMGVIFRRKDNNNYYRFAITSDGFMTIGQMVNGVYDPFGLVAQPYIPGQWVNVTIDVKSYQLHVFVNGQIVFVANNGAFASGGIGLYTYNTTNASFDDVLVLSNMPPASNSATFLKTDTVTQGSWKGVYGADGEVIEADSSNYPSYAQAFINNAFTYQWATSTNDPRALQKAAGPDRIASTWYSPTNFNIDLTMTPGTTHQVALYLNDWDSSGPRVETINVLDGVTGALIDSHAVSNFSGGEYLVWTVQGHVKFQAVTVSGSNAVINGFFFGAGGNAPPPGGTATFLKTDTTTQGSWKGVYGADGEVIEADSSNYPSYAQAFINNAFTYQWATSTNDPRALQKAAGPDRIASTWYSPTNFNIDLTMTPGTTHQVALYVDDWDNSGPRVETINVLDGVTNSLIDSRTIGNFTGGKYLIWNVQGHVKFQAVLVSGANAVISGFFFGSSAAGFTNSLDATMQPAPITVRVFPDPFRASRGDKSVNFDMMPANTTVKLFTVSGRWVKTLQAPAGAASWDLTNDAGDKVASGLYLYLATDNQGHKTHGKFALIR